MRRYEFHRQGRVVWSLVLDKNLNRWCIEMWEPEKESAQFTLAEFESSAYGSQLSEQLAEAMRDAEADA